MWCFRKHRLHANQSTRQAGRETMNSGYFQGCARWRIRNTGSHIETSVLKEAPEDLQGDTHFIADRTTLTCTCKLNTLHSMFLLLE